MTARTRWWYFVFGGKVSYPNVYKYQFSFPVNPRFTVFRITNTIHKETIFTGVGASRLPPTFLGFEFDGFVDLWFSLKSWIHGLNGACRRYQGACGVNLLWFIWPILIVGEIDVVSNSRIGIEMILIPNNKNKTGLKQIVPPKMTMRWYEVFGRGKWVMCRVSGEMQFEFANTRWPKYSNHFLLGDQCPGPTKNTID